jgi:hypothetical protein
MWLPHATRVNLGAGVGGGPYDDTRKPKVCWHMTQGTTLAGARAAFAAYPPHLGYNPASRELEQYVPLDRHSYAFFNSEADNEYIIQIEVVGFSEQAHNMPDWQVQNIVDDLVNPLEEFVGVPPVVIWHGFHGEGEGIVLATPSSPIRITLGQLREFAGHLGHQHIPGDGHWDPGRFRIDEVLRRSQEDDVSGADVWGYQLGLVQPDGTEVARQAGDIVRYLELGEAITRGIARDASTAAKEALTVVRRVEAKVDALTNTLSDDEAKILAAIRALPPGSGTGGLTPEQVEEVVRSVFADAGSDDSAPTV